MLLGIIDQVWKALAFSEGQYIATKSVNILFVNKFKDWSAAVLSSECNQVNALIYIQKLLHSQWKATNLMCAVLS